MPSSLVIRVKRFLWTYCRPLLQITRRIRTARRHEQEKLMSPRMKSIEQALIERHGLIVNGGPFRGMRYMAESHGSALAPKLVGSYEAEVSGMIEEYCARAGASLRSPVTVVDIGCDEGYYAVGLALRLPSARIYAFDINPQAQQDCQKMAVLNNVQERVFIEGECTWERLEKLLQPEDLLICDCEGCEFYLLDPAKTPALKRAPMIVELHDSEYLDRNITPTLVARFQSTHHIELVTAQRRREDWPAVQFLQDPERRLAVNEGRSLGQQWALLRPK
jgi:Methyltransferase domain